MFTKKRAYGKHLNHSKLYIFGSGRTNLKTQTFKPVPKFDHQNTNMNYQKTKRPKRRAAPRKLRKNAKNRKHWVKHSTITAQNAKTQTTN